MEPPPVLEAALPAPKPAPSVGGAVGAGLLLSMTLLGVQTALLLPVILARTDLHSVSAGRGRTVEVATSDPGFLIAALLSFQLAALAIFLVSRAVLAKSDQPLPALHTGSVRRALAIGSAIGVPLSVLSTVVAVLFGWLFHVTPTSPVEGIGNFPLGAQVAVAVLGTFGAAIVEELFFRGLLLGLFLRADKTNLGIVVTSVIFGLFHWSDPAVVVTVTLMGALLAYVYAKSKSIYASMAVHAVNNGLKFVFFFVMAAQQR